MEGAVVDEIVRIVSGIVRPHGGNDPVPLHRPFFFEPFRFYGDPIGYEFVDRFEAEIAKVTGAKHVVAVSSGTAALHLALLAVKELMASVFDVTMPSLAFAAASAAVRYSRSVLKFGETYADVRLAVHLLGEPDPWMLENSGDLSVTTSRHFHKAIVEDAAEAFGSYGDDGKHLGLRGDIGILSFNNNKIVTTNGGGAVITDDADLAKWVRHMATTARDPARPGFFEHDAVGYNYRMPNLCAALGLWQLRDNGLERIRAHKFALAARYAAKLLNARLPGVDLPLPSDRRNNWLTPMTVPAGSRDQVIAALRGAGIEARPLFTPLHRQKPYQHCYCTPEEAERADRLFETTVLLPGGMIG